jgi:hypothetical protein
MEFVLGFLTGAVTFGLVMWAKYLAPLGDPETGAGAYVPKRERHMREPEPPPVPHPTPPTPSIIRTPR